MVKLGRFIAKRPRFIHGFIEDLHCSIACVEIPRGISDPTRMLVPSEVIG